MFSTHHFAFFYIYQMQKTLFHKEIFNNSNTESLYLMYEV